MPSVHTRIAYFLSSFAPLWVVLGVIAVPAWIPFHAWIEGAFYAVAVLSLAWLYYYITDLKDSRPREIKVVSVTPKDKEVTNYLIFYIFPFLGFDLGSPKEAGALGLLFVVLGILYVRARMTYVHPMLAIVGYHFYEVEIESRGERKKCGLITPEPYVRVGQWLEDVYEKEDYVYLQTLTSDSSSDGSHSSPEATNQPGESQHTSRDTEGPHAISP